MSDRLAVFSHGRVEQVGTPAEVYERPATGFVAGFVGVSNVLDGDAAAAVMGDPRAVTIRPEKIQMRLEPSGTVDADHVSVDGTVQKVVYLGAVTRYEVALDTGGTLVVMQQNLRTSSMEALQVRGRTVQLVWERQHARPVEEARGASEAEAIEQGGNG